MQATSADNAANIDPFSRSSALSESDNVDARVKPRPADDRDHLGKNSAGLKARAGHTVALAARLLLGTGQRAQTQGGGELRFAVLRHAVQHRNSN